MAIPDEKLDAIRSATDIVDVVSDYVRLKRAGKSYKGLCPFHDEDTPSFHVDPENNLFHCFGCKEGGDVFSFVQKMEGIGFLESARYLADRSGISLPQSAAEEQAASHRESIYQALRMAARFFYRQRTQSDEGAPARRYLSERGFSAETLKTFGVGYAPDAWDALLTHGRNEHVDAEVMHKAGLIIPRAQSDGYYDRYRHRVIFPLFSHIGKVVGFAGRILDTEADQPKYINSPDTPVYNKSKVLYGLHQGKQAIRREKEVWVVEGYTDVMALHQVGIQHAVATCGTALTREHVQLLERYADRIILLFDGDEAGGRAARDGLQQVLAEGLGAYAVTLPAGHDPDSYIQEHGVDALHAHVENTQSDLPQFVVEQAHDAGRMDTPENRVAVQRDMLRALTRIPDDNLRREYVRRASDVLDVPHSDLFTELNKMEQAEASASRRRAPRPQAPRPQAPPPEDAPRTEQQAEANEETPPARILPEERLLLRLMLEEGTPMIRYVLNHMSLEEFTEGPARDLVDCLMKMYKAGDVRTERIMQGEEGDTLQKLAAAVRIDPHSPSDNWEHRRNIRVPRFNEQPYESAASAMTFLKLDRVKEAMHAARQQLHRADRTGDEEALSATQKKIMQLQDLKKHIQQRAYLSEAPAR